MMDDPEIVFEGVELTPAERKLVKEASDEESDAAWATVLQDILDAEAMAGVRHIDVMAGYSCSKARPGEFGGWSMRIERGRIRSGGTSGLFREWDRRNQRTRDLKRLCKIAARVALSKVERQSLARVQREIARG